MIRKNDGFVDISSTSGTLDNNSYKSSYNRYDGRHNGVNRPYVNNRPSGYSGTRSSSSSIYANVNSGAASYDRQRNTNSRNSSYNRSNNRPNNPNNYKSTTPTEPNGNKSKKSKKKNRIILIMIIVLEVLLLIVAGAFALFMHYFGGLDTQPLTSDASALGIQSQYDFKNKLESDDTLNELIDSNKTITNIALFGIDTRNNNSNGRSDAIMILSVDEIHGKIKLTSILRDSYVPIDKHGKDKIAHAYAYGGPELAIKTLNQNFNLDIREYVTVNFNQLSQVIDAIGGIDIEITKAELKEINRIVIEMHDENPSIDGETLDDYGLVHLTGAQATAFSRIRKIDSDNERANRQQKVLMALFDKCKNMPKTDYPGFIKELLPLVKTSLDYGDIIGLAPIMLTSNLTIEQNMIPDEQIDNPIGGTYNGTWVWRYDLDEAADRLHEFIYEDSLDALTGSSSDADDNDN